MSPCNPNRLHTLPPASLPLVCQHRDGAGEVHDVNTLGPDDHPGRTCCPVCCTWLIPSDYRTRTDYLEAADFTEELRDVLRAKSQYDVSEYENAFGMMGNLHRLSIPVQATVLELRKLCIGVVVDPKRDELFITHHPRLDGFLKVRVKAARAEIVALWKELSVPTPASEKSAKFVRQMMDELRDDLLERVYRGEWLRFVAR